MGLTTRIEGFVELNTKIGLCQAIRRAGLADYPLTFILPSEAEDLELAAQSPGLCTDEATTGLDMLWVALLFNFRLSNPTGVAKGVELQYFLQLPLVNLIVASTSLA